MYRLAIVEIQVHFPLLGDWIVQRDIAPVFVETFVRAVMSWSRLQDHRMDLCRDNERQGWHERFHKHDRPGNDIWLRPPRNGWKGTANGWLSRPNG